MYKHKFNNIVYDTEEELKAVKTGVKVWKIYPKIKDNPTPLPELSEEPTEEELTEYQAIELANIEYMVKEYV